MTRAIDALEKSFDVNGISLAAKAWGDTRGMPVLALHGWLDNAATFERIAPYLPGCYVVAPDFAGHGRSAHRRRDSGYYLWEHAFDVNSLVKGLGWTSFCVVAHSMGSGVASILSSINKDIRAMVFLDGMGAPFTLEHGKTVEHVQRARRLADMARNCGLYGFSGDKAGRFARVEEALAERRNGVGGTLSEAAARLLAGRDLVRCEGGYRWGHDPRLVLPEPMQLSRQQADDFVRQIDCPLHLMLGRGGLFADTFEQRKKALPPSTQVQWHDGGHHFHLDDATDDLRSSLASIIVNAASLPPARRQAASAQENI